MAKGVGAITVVLSMHFIIGTEIAEVSVLFWGRVQEDEVKTVHNHVSFCQSEPVALGCDELMSFSMLFDVFRCTSALHLHAFCVMLASTLSDRVLMGVAGDIAAGI